MVSIHVFGVVLAMDSTAEADRIDTLKLLWKACLILVSVNCHSYNIASQIESSARILVFS